MQPLRLITNQYIFIAVEKAAAYKAMSYRTNTDNIYAEGTPTTAKENPLLKLKIIKYYQRIYYCAVVGDEGRRQLAYFERELVPLAG